MFGPMGPPQGPPMPPGPMGAPPMGAPPMPGAPVQNSPGTLMSALLGTLGIQQQQETQALTSEHSLQVAQLVASMQQPSVGGAMAVSEPAPPGMGVDPMGMGAESEDPMAGGY
jgi:hypothetical protein